MLSRPPILKMPFSPTWLSVSTSKSKKNYSEYLALKSMWTEVRMFSLSAEVPTWKPRCSRWCSPGCRINIWDLRYRYLGPKKNMLSWCRRSSLANNDVLNGLKPKEFWSIEKSPRSAPVTAAWSRARELQLVLYERAKPLRVSTSKGGGRPYLLL